MKQKVLLLITMSIILLTSISCEKEKPLPTNPGYATGVFVWCEGAFNANNGSISWYNPDSALIVNNLFQAVNGRPAGDVIQSFALAGDYGVIVANNSGKIEIVEMVTFESEKTITGFSYPRYFAYSGNGSGYLSNGSMQGHVYRIDIEAGKVTDTIEVGMGPEQVLISGNYLYVANSGGWADDNSVSVIDTGTDKVIKTIIVGDTPVALVADINGNIWVLCRGKVVYNETWTEIIEETDSRLVRISPLSLEADREIIIGEKGDYFNPSYLAISPSGEELYFGELDGLFSMGIQETVQPSVPVTGKQFSSVGIQPGTGLIFALEITDYTSPGKLHIYDSDNEFITHETGIAPGGIVFAD
jgi:YVTN family beta-propeller protein